MTKYNISIILFSIFIFFSCKKEETIIYPYDLRFRNIDTTILSQTFTSSGEISDFQVKYPKYLEILPSDYPYKINICSEDSAIFYYEQNPYYQRPLQTNAIILISGNDTTFKEYYIENGVTYSCIIPAKGDILNSVQFPGYLSRHSQFDEDTQISNVLFDRKNGEKNFTLIISELSSKDTLSFMKFRAVFQK